MNNDFPFNHFINFDKFNNNNNLESSHLDKLSQKEEKITPNEGTKLNNSKLLQDNQFSQDELQSICEEVLEGLKQNISPQKYAAFFQNTFTLTSITDNKIIFSVTTNFIKKMIVNHYLEEIQEILFQLMGTKYHVEITVINTKNSLQKIQKDLEEDILKEEVKKAPKSENLEKMSFKLDNFNSKNEIKDEIESAVIQHTTSNLNNRKFDRSKKFDNFIVGPSNNMAYAFSLAVAKDPGKVYPQLYIHGNSGLGKTHLLHALCNHVSENKPYLRICFTNANEFMSEMVMAIQSTTGKDNKINEFRRKYTELVDILIIDDIHELKNKTRTQSEFFYIFNELQNKGKQLVFTSDKPPKEIVGIEDRIRTRLSSALLIDIQQPDLETRIAILKKKAIEKDIYLDDDVINLIASCVKTNVRELEGKLVKLGAYSDLMNVDIDLEIAKEQLNLSEGIDDKVITVESITKSVANYFKLALGDIKGKSRKKEVALARHISMYMSHKILKKTLEEIGEYFDNRDHSTVIHGIKKVQNLIKEGSKVSQQIYEIESRL
ncbi:MAG: chromosomal replication initiator protein DnaA [Bacteriovoracaceae bacterium]|jgi:chromosomal replication initiator protein|nr:chromosomal replication initiator protein DnaA [Bacteriovoracaceae bacterium]